MERMSQEVMDRIDYYCEALKISNEKSDYDEYMEKMKHYKPSDRLGVHGTFEVK